MIEGIEHESDVGTSLLRGRHRPVQIGGTFRITVVELLSQ